MPSTSEQRAPRSVITIAILSAMVVGAAAAGASFSEGALADYLPIAAPSLAAALIVPVFVHRLITIPFRDENRAAIEKAETAALAIRGEHQKRSALKELDQALDHAKAEANALDIIAESLARLFPDQGMEVHLVDALDPVLSLAVTTGNMEHLPGERVSPWDAMATRSSTTLVYKTTERLNVCGHLKSRLSGPMAAVAVPVNARGRILGVMYSFAPVGHSNTKDELVFLEDLASIIAARIAVIRSVDSTTALESVDRLTGLPDRSTMQDRVLRLLEDRQPFSVAVADIDGFGELNETEGRKAGDEALQTLARVARRTVRPEDVVGRIGGDEMLFILPRTLPDDATRALERLREELVLVQSTSDTAAFTLSIGVIGSAAGASIEEILHRAASALTHAKSQGGNRVVVAQPTESQEHG